MNVGSAVAGREFVAGLLAITTGNDRSAIFSLPCRVTSMPTGRNARLIDASTKNVLIVLSGAAFTHQLARDGARQITAIGFPGDMIALHRSLSDEEVGIVEPLGDCEIAAVPRSACLALMTPRMAIAPVLMHQLAREVRISHEWMVNIARRDAYTRLAHFICEMCERRAPGSDEQHRAFRPPMTQQEIADCLGLTSVHVNRMLKLLALDGLITSTSGTTNILDWHRLVIAGDFDPSYLQMPGQHPILGTAD